MKGAMAVGKPRRPQAFRAVMTRLHLPLASLTPNWQVNTNKWPLLVLENATVSDWVGAAGG